MKLWVADQFCTNPGIAVVVAGAEADAFASAAKKALSEVGTQTMLTDGIATAFNEGVERVKSTPSVSEVFTSTSSGRTASPNLFATTGKEWLANESLGEEVFGPLGIIVAVEDLEEMTSVANVPKGQLTCTLHMDDDDTEVARSLLPILERKSGRVLANGFPTEVEVCDSMVHGGPYPASTNFGATSVGTMSIRRFLRPVAYQNMPAALLSEDLRP